MTQNDIERKASSYALDRYPNMALTGYTGVDMQNAARNGYVDGVAEYLKSVWHDAEEVPTNLKEEIVFASDNGYYGGALNPKSWNYYNKIGIMESLLPDLKYLLRNYENMDTEAVGKEVEFLRKEVKKAEEKHEALFDMKKAWSMANKYNQRWAYLSDLLPKGGEG